MIKYDQLKEKPKQFLAATGVTTEKLAALHPPGLTKRSPSWQRRTGMSNGFWSLLPIMSINFLSLIYHACLAGLVSFCDLWNLDIRFLQSLPSWWNKQGWKAQLEFKTFGSKRWIYSLRGMLGFLHKLFWQLFHSILHRSRPWNTATALAHHVLWDREYH